MGATWGCVAPRGVVSCLHTSSCQHCARCCNGLSDTVVQHPDACLGKVAFGVLSFPRTWESGGGLEHGFLFASPFQFHIRGCNANENQIGGKVMRLREIFLVLLFALGTAEQLNRNATIEIYNGQEFVDALRSMTQGQHLTLRLKSEAIITSSELRFKNYTTRVVDDGGLLTLKGTPPFTKLDLGWLEKVTVSPKLPAALSMHFHLGH